MSKGKGKGDFDHIAPQTEAQSLTALDHSLFIMQFRKWINSTNPSDFRFCVDNDPED